MITIEARAPLWAPNGSAGYFLTVTRPNRVTGWIRVGKDGRTVYATLGGRPWRVVGAVDVAADLTPEWVTAHVADIARA